MQLARTVSALLCVSVGGLKVNVSPDLTARVAEETHQNLQIHDFFQSQEDQDDQEVKLLKARSTGKFLQRGRWVVALDKDMKTHMLIQTSKAQPIKDACAAIPCGTLSCPGGFKATSIPGHCCPYCVNPEIKLEDAVTGATGKSGGSPSTFCKDVYCFPTLCTKAVSNPSGANGQCCPTCPAL